MENTLKLFNSLTLKTELFQSAHDKQVKMYTCGPSTYQRAHIGNYRTFLFEDVLQRYLEYLGFNVTRLITLTNLEDKAIMSAETANLSVDELTRRNESVFFSEFEKLHIKSPDFSVRASTILDQAVKLIRTLIQKQIAYRYKHDSAANVYFDPLKFAGFGKLAHLDMKKWPKKKRRFHLDTYPGMPWNRGDFVLWHGCRESDRVCWDTQLGRGRPAWNVQDAAMVTKHLGFSVDVACGGIDNLVRHHDYTLAVAEAVSGKTFSRFWLHGGHLDVDGKKMSKSKGNVLYLDNLVERGYNYSQIRFFLIYGAYRKRRNFTWQALAETSRRLDSFKESATAMLVTEAQHSSPAAKTLAHSLPATFCTHMNNDLDVEGAFSELRENVYELRSLALGGKLGRGDAEVANSDLRKIDEVLQVIF